MKILYLNGILAVPSDSGYDKLLQAKENKNSKQPNWESLGLPTPKDEIQYDEDGLVILEEEDTEYVATSVTIVLSQYSSAEDIIDGGCMVYTKDGMVHRVLETADEVSSYAEMLDMSWLERNFVLLKSQIKKIFTKKEIKDEEYLLS